MARTMENCKFRFGVFCLLVCSTFAGDFKNHVCSIIYNDLINYLRGQPIFTCILMTRIELGNKLMDKAEEYIEDVISKINYKISKYFNKNV